MNIFNKIKQLTWVMYLSLLPFQINAQITTKQSILSFKVTEDGIYRVNHTDIKNHGIDLIGIDLSYFALQQNGNAVPITIHSNDGVLFDDNSFIEFVGTTEKTLYQNGKIYNLILNENTQNARVINADQEPIIGQETVTHYMHSYNYEENTGYSFGSPTGDPWFAKRILAIGSEASEIISFELQDFIPFEEVTMELTIWGGTDYLQSPDHHVIYQLNGNIFDDFRFDGITSVINNYQFNSQLFANGSHEVKVIVPNDTNTVADVIHIESMKVSYPRAFVLQNKQMDFKTQGFDANSDLIFFNGFEQGTQTSTIHYSIKNASNENYVIYKNNLDGSVNLIQSKLSDDCNSNPTLSCELFLTTDNRSARVFVSSESQISTPEITVPTLLTDISQPRATYLIITHSYFIGPELNVFVDLKQQNHEVKVVDVEQIYAQYGHSNISANSIATYIKYAALNLGVKNVLLVGGDTYDYHNYLGLNSISYIPTLYQRTDDLITYAPVDAKFVDLDNDNIPDINIGRFPVRTVSELATLISKIESYASKSYEKTALFAADKFDVSNGYSFKADAEEFIALLPTDWQENIGIDNKAYLDDDGVALAKSKIINTINQGVALTSFIGHSGPRDWSFSRMFSASDALVLNNLNSPTLVTQWGCWNTYFVSPEENTLAHAFMLNQNGGAASVLGASTLTKAQHERELAKIVLKHLTQNEMSLGNAVTQAKRQYARTNPDALDVILGWNILGDPSLKL